MELSVLKDKGIILKNLVFVFHLSKYGLRLDTFYFEPSFYLNRVYFEHTLDQ